MSAETKKGQMEALCRAGDIIHLERYSDEEKRLPGDAFGVVDFIDGEGRAHIMWRNGSYSTVDIDDTFSVIQSVQQRFESCVGNREYAEQFGEILLEKINSDEESLGKRAWQCVCAANELKNATEVKTTFEAVNLTIMALCGWSIATLLNRTDAALTLYRATYHITEVGDDGTTLIGDPLECVVDDYEDIETLKSESLEVVTRMLVSDKAPSVKYQVEQTISSISQLSDEEYYVNNDTCTVEFDGTTAKVVDLE